MLSHTEAFAASIDSGTCSMVPSLISPRHSASTSHMPFASVGFVQHLCFGCFLWSFNLCSASASVSKPLAALASCLRVRSTSVSPEGAASASASPPASFGAPRINLVDPLTFALAGLLIATSLDVSISVFRGDGEGMSLGAMFG